MQKYDVNNIAIESILNFIKSDIIAIPEIQRPFVWTSSKVRDLIDSLYNGYPVGYIITWKNPDTKLKDGTSAIGKKILIDGQQRVTALTTSLLGQNVIGNDYKKKRIKIAFHPIKEKFEVFNSAIAKDSHWIQDISKFINEEVDKFKFVMEYSKKHENVDPSHLNDIINKLTNIKSRNIGIIDLSHELDIETVTEIFIRINSKGVVLSQADFAMSKISVNEANEGDLIRKTIDYFCHLAQNPADYDPIKENDKEFSNTEFFKKLSWIRKENEDLYIPDYSDVLRVAFTYKFKRGKLSDLVSLLSGRNFETRGFEESILEESFMKLKEGVLEFINQTNFNRYLMIIKSAGIINKKLIRSQNTLNFGYILYLTLKEKGIDNSKIERLVRKWLVLSMLTGRYSSSPESAFEYDIKRIWESQNVEDYIQNVEEGELSDAFWSNILITKLNTSVTSSPFYHLYLMAQIKNSDKGFLSKEITVRDMVEHKGDTYHIFPKKYLQTFNYKKGQYNQIANYVYMQSEINIKVGAKAPEIYFNELKEQC